MRSAGIRRFHKNMWEELEDLPVVITKHSSPKYVILPWEMWDRAQNPTKRKPIVGILEENDENKERPSNNKYEKLVSENAGVI